MHLDINCTMTKHIPLGISFFTLQIIGYLIDIYKNKYNPEPQLINYLIFVSLFPIVVSGPIERGDSLLPQIRRLNAVKFDYKRVSEGCRLLLFGYLLKVLISERLAYIISIVYSDVNSSSGLILLVTTFLFTIQIYCDFCGYTYIALGAAKIIGLELTQNSYYQKTYIASYEDKLSQLKSINGEKTVFIGGSSVALGINAEYFSSLSDRQAINMGLYAMKSYDIYLGTIEPYINKNDIVVLQLEYVAYQNDYWDYNDVGLDIANLIGCYDDTLSFPHRLQYYQKQFLRSYGRLFESTIFTKGPMKEKLYLRSNVNEYGDFFGHKNMPSNYEGNSHFNYTINDSAIKNILKYIEKFEEKGATVYINFQPYCVCDDSDTVERQSDYIYSKLKQCFCDRLLQKPIDNIYYDKSCFFDTDSHLNYSESLKFTEKTFSCINSKQNSKGLN